MGQLFYIISILTLCAISAVYPDLHCYVCTDCATPQDLKSCDAITTTTTEPTQSIGAAETTTTVPTTQSTGGTESTTTVPTTQSTGGAESTTAVPTTQSTGGAESTTILPTTQSTGGAESTTTVPNTQSSLGAESTTAVPTTQSTEGAESTTTVPTTQSTGGAESTTTVPNTQSTGGAESTTTVSTSQSTGGAESTIIVSTTQSTGRAESTITVPNTQSIGGAESTTAVLTTVDAEASGVMQDGAPGQPQARKRRYIGEEETGPQKCLCHYGKCCCNGKYASMLADDGVIAESGTYQCYKHIRKENGSDIIDRGCKAVTQNETACDILNANSADCFVCDTDKCNSAFVLQLPIVLIICTALMSIIS